MTAERDATAELRGSRSADATRGGGLRTIFSFFLGLMLTAFVGVGVYTFHPPPDRHDRELRDLGRREQTVRDARAPAQLTNEDRAEIEEIHRRREQLGEEAEAARRVWGRSTSVVLIIFATLAMAVSLVRADQLPVISNGLLLGGVFTMLYGVGWIIASDSSVARFLVITVALIITLALGYLRFVGGGRPVPAVAGAGGAGPDDFVTLERRLAELEARMNDAARALAPGGDPSREP